MIKLILVFAFASTLLYGSPYTLEEYIQDVKELGGAYSLLSRDIAEDQLLSREGELLFSPELVVQSDYTRGFIPTWQLSFLSGIDLNIKNLQVGIEQKTSFGLSWKLLAEHYEVENVNESPYLLPLKKGRSKDFGGQVAFEQDLWRNGFGKETRAKANESKYYFLKSMYRSMHEREGALLRAKKAYWNLSVAEAKLRLHKQMLAVSGEYERIVSKKHEDFLAIELQSQLADLQEDRYQSELYLESIEVIKKRAEFNRYRGAEVNAPIGELQSIGSFVSNFQPDLTPPNDFINNERKMHEKYLESKISQEIESLKPEFKCFGGVSRKKLTSDFIPFLQQKERRRELVLGAKLKIPLNRWLLNEIKDSYEKKKRLAHDEYDYRKKEKTEIYAGELKEFDQLKSLAKALEDLCSAEKELVQSAKENYEKGLISKGDLVKIEHKSYESQINLLKAYDSMSNLIFKMSYVE